MHAHIHTQLAQRGLGDVPILYGGSVKPGNAGAIFAVAYVDGALVGGASLVADDFAAICDAAQATSMPLFFSRRITDWAPQERASKWC